MEPLVITGDAMMPGESSKLQLCDDGKAFLLRGFPIYPCVSVFFPGQEPITWWHRNYSSSCAWSPNGKIMASGSHTGMLHLRLRNNPLKKVVVSTHGKNLDTLRFSPDGTRLVVGGSDGTFDLWDISALHELSNEIEDSDPDATAELTAAEAGKASRLESVRPVLIGTTKAHLSGGIKSVVFSADGSRLATFAAGDSKLWHLDRVRGRYEVADFGEDMFNGRVGFLVEDSDRGLRVSRIYAGSDSVVSGELRVGDILTGGFDERYGQT